PPDARERLERVFDRDPLQAIVVAEAAGACQTRAALDVLVEHPRPRPERTGPIGPRRPEDADGRQAERACNVHRSRVVADESAAEGEQRDEIADVGLPSRDDRADTARRGDLLAPGSLARRPD